MTAKSTVFQDVKACSSTEVDVAFRRKTVRKQATAYGRLCLSSYLLVLLFDPVDGDNLFFRNVNVLLSVYIEFHRIT
jgi:hypothetical protein